MSSIKETVGYGAFSVLLAKKLEQREEHKASVGAWKYTKMYNKKFYHIHWFAIMPQSLIDVVRIIDMKGAKYDGKAIGEYHLLARPRGIGKGRMLGGADLFYDGLKIALSRLHEEEREYCNDYFFLKFLGTKDKTNAWLKKVRFGGV